MKKYFKIGEVSRLYHIGVDSIRYYEEMGILQPKRSESGYRLYSIKDIWRINVIRDFLELGFSITQIKSYLLHHTVDSTVAFLTEEEKTIDRKLKELTIMRDNVEKRLSTIAKAKTIKEEVIETEELPARRYYAISEGYTEEHEMDVLIQRLLNIDKEHFYIVGNNQIGTVLSYDKTETEKMVYESVFIIDENGEKELPAGTYLSISYKGAYEKSAHFAKKLLSYAAEHGMKIMGKILELLWIDIHTSSDISEHMTQLQVRVDIKKS